MFICPYSISNFYYRNILFLQTLEGPWVSYIPAKQKPNDIIPSITAAKIHKLKTLLLVSMTVPAQDDKNQTEKYALLSSAFEARLPPGLDCFVTLYCPISHVKIWGILSVQHFVGNA